MENNNTQRERLKTLFKHYKLDREDIFTMKMGGRKIPIVTRTGIEKIMSHDNIKLKYDVIVCERDFCAVKCMATKETENGTIEIESYSTAQPKNCKSTYYLEMAEKRSKGRAILMLTEFSSLGVYSEVEADDFKRPPQPTPPTDKDEPKTNLGNIEQAFIDYNS